MKTKHTTLAAALVAAQSQMENPKYDAVNPHFKNRYASLKAVRAAVLPPLNDNGITVIQNIISIEGGIGCTTVLIHESEQTMSFGPLTMPVARQDAQGYGSGITYACRYALCAVFGVTGEDDDDSEAAVGRPKEAAKPLFVKQQPEATLEMLLKKANAEFEHGGLVIPRFLKSKGAWPKDCNELKDLDNKTIARLLTTEAWKQVQNFAEAEELKDA